MKRKINVVIIIMILWSTSLWANTAKSQKLVEEAWSSWEANEQQLVEDKFLAALKEDENNIRAYLGLTLLYALQDKDKEAWINFQKVLEAADNPFPYVFSASLFVHRLFNQNDPDPDVVDFWNKLSAKADKGGLLKAIANQYLGGYFERRNQLEKSRQYYKNINAIDQWTVIGPFDNISASGFNRAFPPEQEYQFDKIYQGKNGIPAKWFKIAEFRPDYWIDFRRYFAHDQAIFYANNFVYSPQKQTVQIRIGTSGSLKAFLNDALVIEYFDENNNDLDTYIAETELQEGWNRLLVKVGYSEINRCNFMVRITDAYGERVKNLKISTESQTYSHLDNLPVASIANFAETYFRNKVEENPGHLENYVMLAQCYLRNDKAILGELALKEALKRSPNCALFNLHILDAYTRGEKIDEVVTTMEKLASLNNDIPAVLEYKFNKFIRNEQFQKAEEILTAMAAKDPQSEDIYSGYLTLYSSKRQREKVIETVRQGHEKFPGNWQFANMQAFFSAQISSSQEPAIEIYGDQVKHVYTVNRLAALANAYLKNGNIDDWENTYHKIFDLDPSATGHYFQMANTCVILQKNDAAESLIKKAISICPNSSQYWSKLGEIYRVSGKTEEAKKAYRESLNYNPANYESREILRELQGKKSIFSNFENIEVAKLIKEAPNAGDYPNDDALFVYQHLQRVVYQHGASESTEEILIRVFNSRGIDDYKEYAVGHNAYTEGLIIEKAVVIKSDLSEIKADVNKNYVVFKSLEEGDFIHLKWRIKNYYSGKLSNHFWDQYYFNNFVPVKDIRYSLLVPRGFKFQYDTQNMPKEPNKKETDDGTIYQWRLTNEPGIVYEAGMPILEDVGKILYISSIDDWEYMVDWYRDIAQTKTKSSFEIKEVVQQLFNGAQEASEREKIEIIYNFITENIRYSSVSFRQSGLIPQEARDVLVNKIGDCKDVSTLCIAMLNEAGIKAHYVLVNTKEQGLNRKTLPSIDFNHCITGVETEKGVRYLDLTAGNFPFGSIPNLDIEGFALLIKPGVKKPHYLQAKQFIPRKLLRKMRVIIKEDNSVVFEKESIRTGSLAAAMRAVYRDQSQSAREKRLLETLSKDFPNITLTKLEIENLDNVNADIHYIYHFLAPDYVSDVGSFKIIKMPWTDKLGNNKALSYPERKFPYYYWPAADTLREEMEIILPPGYEPAELGKNISITSAVADYSVELLFENGIIKGRREFVNKKSVVMPEEYLEFKNLYNTALKNDNSQILISPVEQN